MEVTRAHRALAEKFIFKNAWSEPYVPESLYHLTVHAYTEEEAELVASLGLTALPARLVALKLRRPLSEIEPMLQSLAERALIFSTKIKGVRVYGFLPLGPGVFEAQMLRAKGDTESEYYKEFAKLFEQVYHDFFSWIKPKISDKDLRFGRIIPIEKSLDSSPGVGIVALNTDKYSELLDRNRSFCLMNYCACRHEQDILGNWCGKPKDVCAAMGWIADWAIEQGWGRRVSKEEFMDAKMRAAEAGLVNMVDNLRDPMQVCSCCGCCCGALRILNEFNIPTIIAKSHFEAATIPDKCIGCGTCEEFCPMNAISIVDGKAQVDYARCIGCGVCVIKCDNHAMIMKERQDHKPPADSLVEFAVNRFWEMKGTQASLLPKLTLGLGKLLGDKLPLQLSGPRYKPRN